jgi:hypothetical protein
MSYYVEAEKNISTTTRSGVDRTEVVTWLDIPRGYTKRRIWVADQRLIFALNKRYFWKRTRLTLRICYPITSYWLCDHVLAKACDQRPSPSYRLLYSREGLVMLGDLFGYPKPR